MIKFSHKLKFCIILGIALSHLLSGSDLKKVTIQLDWIFNAQFAGIYQAKEQGYYREAELEVSILPAKPGMKTVDSVLNHEIAFGSAESNVLISAHAAGAPIKAIATMFQSSPLGWFSLSEKNIKTVKDFQEKKIGIHPDGDKVVRLIAIQNGLSLENITLKDVGYTLDPIINGELDAMQGYYIDEYVKFQQLTNNNAEFLFAKDFGYSSYSQVIFCSEKLSQSNPQLVKDFLQATQKGWEYALDNQEKTLKLILQYNPDLDLEYQKESLKKIEELVRPEGKSALSPMQMKIWSNGMEAYKSVGLIEKETDLSKLVDLSFNP